MPQTIQIQPFFILKVSLHFHRNSPLFSGCSPFSCFCFCVSVWYFSTDLLENEVMDHSAKRLFFFLQCVLSRACPASFLFIFLYSITLSPSTAALGVLGKFHTAAKRGVAVESEKQVL